MAASIGAGVRRLAVFVRTSRRLRLPVPACATVRAHVEHPSPRGADQGRAQGPGPELRGAGAGAGAVGVQREADAGAGRGDAVVPRGRDLPRAEARFRRTGRTAGGADAGAARAEPGPGARGGGRPAAAVDRDLLPEPLGVGGLARALPRLRGRGGGRVGAAGPAGHHRAAAAQPLQAQGGQDAALASAGAGDAVLPRAGDGGLLRRRLRRRGRTADPGAWRVRRRPCARAGRAAAACGGRFRPSAPARPEAANRREAALQRRHRAEVLGLRGLQGPGAARPGPEQGAGWPSQLKPPMQRCSRPVCTHPKP
mmetsp:Transcript_21863/g.85655  ORF Transcript_21863/g.85655 Transcript_21863/m.85655 type:complete len:311 (+) Transcript_21863:282-1214(+)